MRDKVLAAIEAYAGGGTVDVACAAAGISREPFYRFIRKDPDVMAAYEACQKCRSFVMADEAYEIGSDAELNAGFARAAIDARLRLAAILHPDRFGQRSNVQIEAKPSLVAAIDEGKRRAALPQRDLGNVIEADYTEIQPITHAGTSDKQSAAPAFALAPGDIDPFAP